MTDLSSLLTQARIPFWIRAFFLGASVFRGQQHRELGSFLPRDTAFLFVTINLLEVLWMRMKT